VTTVGAKKETEEPSMALVFFLSLSLSLICLICKLTTMADNCFDVDDLLWASRYNQLAELQELVRAHASQVNCQDERGSTALHMASANGHIDAMNLLLSAGASVDLCNAEGNSALHWACSNGRSEAVRLLMEHKAEPSKLNAFERTPVDEALDSGHRACVDIIKSFAEANDEDEVDDVEEENVEEMDGPE
jgi:uncharacterized protein